MPTKGNLDVTAVGDVLVRGGPLAELVSIRKLENLLGRSRRDIERIASVSGRYHAPFDIQPPGGKWRHIDNPTGELRALQQRLLPAVRDSLCLPECMVGVSGRGVAVGAKRHAHKPLVVALDLKKFFYRTSHHRIYKVFREGFETSAKVAALLTQLTTFRSHLTVGAPTSSILGCATLLPLVRKLEALARGADLQFTMTADDVTFSGKLAAAILHDVISAIRSEDYSVACRKLRCMPRHVPQVVTGLVVNDGLRVPDEMIDRITEALMRLQAAEHVTEGGYRTAQGRIAYVASVSKMQAAPLQMEAERTFDRTLSPGAAARRVQVRACRGRRCMTKNI